MLLVKSPVDKVVIDGREFFIKRDDLLSNSNYPFGISGNKARKLAYFLSNELPNISKIISFGGSQSNFMYAASELARLKSWRFDYYSRPLSNVLKSNIQGNLAHAIQNGMHLIESSNCDEVVLNLHANLQAGELVLQQGGAEEYARFGLMQLANEINQFVVDYGLTKLVVFLPSGTGVSAYYLSQYLAENIKLYTTNCVGDSDYLLSQINQLNCNNNLNRVNVLVNNKYRFASLYLELYHNILDVEFQSKITFDRLYDPVGWKILLDNLDEIGDVPIMYVHCGGVLGNATMDKRYQRLSK